MSSSMLLGLVIVAAGIGADPARDSLSGFSEDQPVTFERDIQPILTAAGCNSGGCHGKQRGQNGFQLSLFGFDDDFDYQAIVVESGSRRVFPAAPERSLLLEKPAGRLPHGGGIRLEPGSERYALVHQWIAAGTPRTPREAPALTGISLEPSERILRPTDQQQLVVMAHDSDGTCRDVTTLAAFQSTESAIAKVDPDGLVTAGSLAGTEATIMARFMGRIATTAITIPSQGSVPAAVFAQLPRWNFIDELVWRKLQKTGIPPSRPAAEHQFLRRAYLDVIGRLPTPSEVRAYLADRATGEESVRAKRSELVDQLLCRPEYADFWANQWADLLRPNPYRAGAKAVRSLDAWLRQSFRENKPYDQFVREIVTAQGSTFHNGAVTILRDRRTPDELAPMISQLFLGVRLECAKCHHHPFEVWGQDDFYGFAAYFARLGRKGQGVSPPISGGEEKFFAGTRGAVIHPRTGAEMAPRPLAGTSVDPDPESDRRQLLADWMTSSDNPYFDRVIVNRVWAGVMGRGLVEPVDDLRATNPPTNGPLLDGLAQDFRHNGRNLKELLRTILNSYVYGLASEPTEGNLADTRHHSRHLRQRLRAEVLLDAVSDVTGVPESFSAMPPGSRAVELWTHRSGSLFLDAFGRPDPNQDPPCERTSDASVVQALHMMNSANLHRKVTAENGRAARLANSSVAPEETVEELYLWAYSRFPSRQERAECAALVAKTGAQRRTTTEDLMWALLNTPEFLFKD